MKMRMPLIAAALLASTSGLALAQQTSGPYVGIGGGWNMVRDSDISGSGISSEAEFDHGWAALGTVGYGFGNGLRVELELGYRDNDIDSIGGT